MTARRLIGIAAALLSLTLATQPHVRAQLPSSFMMRKSVGPCGGYTGPGDVTGSWQLWGGLRAFSAATCGTKVANVCNSGDANCADVNALASNGNFDVTTAQGSPLNCGGSGGTCTIKTLYDKSGNSRDIANATAAARPTLAFGCAGLGASKPCMVFARSAGQQLRTAAGVNINQPMTFVAGELQTTNNGGTAYALFDTGGGDGVGFSGSDNQVQCLTAPNTIQPAATDGNWFSVICVASGASSSITLNGTTTGYSGGTVGTGANPMGTNNMDGKIVEAGFTSTALAAGTISSYNSNLRTYWGF
jgi:hypothetical protein